MMKNVMKLFVILVMFTLMFLGCKSTTKQIDVDKEDVKPDSIEEVTNDNEVTDIEEVTNDEDLEKED